MLNGIEENIEGEENIVDENQLTTWYFDPCKIPPKLELRTNHQTRQIIEKCCLLGNCALGIGSLIAGCCIPGQAALGWLWISLGTTGCANWLNLCIGDLLIYTPASTSRGVCLGPFCFNIYETPSNNRVEENDGIIMREQPLPQVENPQDALDADDEHASDNDDAIELRQLDPEL